MRAAACHIFACSVDSDGMQATTSAARRNHVDVMIRGPLAKRLMVLRMENGSTIAHLLC